ncbi:hypothetical protein ACSBR2_021660 [Camellia fascicularis]
MYHLAATQVGQFMKFEDQSETSSSHGGMTSAGAVPVPQLPKLKENRHVIDIARVTKVAQIAFCVLFLVPESDAYPLLE